MDELMDGQLDDGFKNLNSALAFKIEINVQD